MYKLKEKYSMLQNIEQDVLLIITTHCTWLIAKCTLVFVAPKIHVQFVRFIVLQFFKTSTMYSLNQILCTIFFLQTNLQIGSKFEKLGCQKILNICLTIIIIIQKKIERNVWMP